MKSPYKITVIIELLIATVCFVFLPALFIYLADPCHIFHKLFKHLLYHGFTPETRCQNAGLINSWLSDKQEGFDSIIIGSSISQNFIPEYIQTITPWKRTLNLNMVNIAPVEQNIVARKAISSGNVKHIFWEILPMLHHSPKPMHFRNIIHANYFPAYLYNNSALDDYRYIFNATSLSGAVDVFLNETYFVNSINRITYWENKCETEKICDQFYAGSDIEFIQKNYITPTRHTLAKDSITKIIYSDFDNFIFPIIKEHCNSNISFDVFFLRFQCCGSHNCLRLISILSCIYSAILLKKHKLVKM